MSRKRVAQLLTALTCGQLAAGHAAPTDITRQTVEVPRGTTIAITVEDNAGVDPEVRLYEGATVGSPCLKALSAADLKTSFVYAASTAVQLTLGNAMSLSALVPFDSSKAIGALPGGVSIQFFLADEVATTVQIERSSDNPSPQPKKCGLLSAPEAR